MTLQELIDTAKYSELNTLAVKNNTDAIITFVNLGIVELYKRFALKTEEHIITLQDGVTVYTMPEDFMYIIAAYEEVPDGATYNSVSVPINEENNPFSLNTISYDQVQIPLTVAGGYISIIYVPKPTKMTNLDLAVELPIPGQLVTPLLDFIAYRGHAGITNNMQEEGNVNYLRFERNCEKAKDLGVGIAPDDVSMVGRIDTRGFV